MAGIIVQWRPTPLVTVEKEGTGAWVTWHGGISRIFEMGNTVQIQVKFQCRKPYGGNVIFRIYVEKYMPRIKAWIPFQGYYPLEKGYAANDKDWHFDDITIQIPVDDPFLRFRVKVSTQVGGHLPGDSGEGSLPQFMDPNDPNNFKEFLAYVDYYGDFSLEYLPMTILYCPPGQDMYNALTQNNYYGTIIGMGFSEDVGTKSEGVSKVQGGVNLNFGYVSGSLSFSGSEGVEQSESVTEAMTNNVTMTYTWNTTLIADNQRVVGRKYWGPLGDLFLLLKNPWFSLIGTDEGKMLLVESDKTAERTEILIVPGHRLLRPDGDPVASRIPPMTRKKILELDPFYVNLDKFFPSPCYRDEGIACFVCSRKEPKHIPVYRAYDTKKQNYIYTTDRMEFENKWPCYPFLKGGKIAFHIYDPNLPKPQTHVPLYKLVMSSATFRNNDVLLTTSVEERNDCYTKGYQKPASVIGYVVPPYVDPLPPEVTARYHYKPLYRAYSQEKNRHIFTIDLAEFDALGKIPPPPPPEDLSLAVDPYRDPSSNNRAALIARYGISNGVELDLSRVEGITVEDQNISTTSKYFEVTESTGLVGSLGVFANILSIGFDASDKTGEFVKTSYFTSLENVVGKVKTALCKLIRNQNQADLEDIEIYWDKHFSTFMFRKIHAGKGWFGGIVNAGPIMLNGVTLGATVNNVELLLFDMDSILKETPETFAPVFKALGLSPKDPAPDVRLFVNKIIKMNFNIEKVIEDISPKLIESTSSNHMGQYSFRNLRTGVYLLKVGDTLTNVEITDSDIKTGVCKTVDLKNVKRVFDPAKSALWELREILGIDMPTAKRIQLALQKERDINETVFKAVLKSEKLSISDFKSKSVLRFKPEKVQAGEVMLKGWIVDPSLKGARHLDVMLIGTTILKKNYPSFFKDWPDVDVNVLLEKLPPESYYRTKTNYLGKYIIRNVNCSSYQLIAGDKKMEVKVTDDEINKGTIKRLDLKDVKRTINLQRPSFWEIRNAFNTSLYSARRIESSIQKNPEILFDQSDLERLVSSITSITHDDFNLLLKSLNLKFHRTPLERLNKIAPEQIQALKKLNITSIQELWREVKQKKRLKEIAKKTRISGEIVSEWVIDADSKRVLNQPLPTEHRA